MATPSSPKPDINNKIWQNILRRHLLSTAQATAGNYDGDISKARQELASIKSGKTKLHNNATGLAFAEIEAGNTGKYSVSPAEEEAILKEVADKLSHERLAKAEHSVEQEKWNKKSKEVQDKLNKESVETEAKLKKKWGKDIAGYNSAQSKADREMEIKTKKALLELDEKKPKAKSPLSEQISVAKGEGDALYQHRRIMALPEKERAGAFKKLIDTFSEPINDTPESKAQTEHTVKRLQELAAEDGITKPKLSRAIAAVGGAVKKAANATKNAAVSAIPGTGPTVSTPSPVVRPTATANAVPPAPAASTPPPAGLPPPPSAAPAPAASTPPPANLPPPPSAGRTYTSDSDNPKYQPAKPPADTPPTTPAAPAGQGGYPASGKGGVVGVGEGGVAVQIEGDLAAGRKWTPQVRPVVAPDARPAGLTTGAPYGTTAPLTPTAGNAQSGKLVTDATGQTRVGFVSSPTAPKPTGRPIVPATPVKNPSILADLVGPVTESAKMIGGVVGKGTMDVVSGAANLIKKAVVPVNPRDILRGNAEAAKATPAPAKPTATTEADKLPKYAYGYDPATGKQTGGPATKATYGDMGRRVSSFRDNLIPYLNGRNATELRGELAGKHGAYDLETFIQKAANKSGMFTASEVGQVVQQLKGDPMFKGLVDAGLPVDRPKGPFKAGGAPKVEIKDKQGNVLPKGNSVPKATPPPVETAADRLAQIRAAEAQRIAEATAAFTEEQRLAAQAEAERKAVVDAFQNRSPAGKDPAFPAGTRFGEALPFVGNSGVTRQDRLRQISAENKKGVTVDEIMLQRWLKGRTATSTPESQSATGKPAPYIRGMERGVKPPSRGAMLAGQVGGAALQGVGFAPDVFNAARLLNGGAITPDGQILSQTEQMSAAIERMKNLGKPVQPVEDSPWYVNLANVPVEMAKQSWDDIQAIGKFGKYNKTKAQEAEDALQRLTDEAAVRQIYGVSREDSL